VSPCGPSGSRRTLPVSPGRHFERFEVVTITPEIIYAAADCQVLSRLSYWDALIVVTAEIARCGSIYSEDFNPGQKIRGIRIQSPFAP
jgi:predicted nucleic acid-binding protein